MFTGIYGSFGVETNYFICIKYDYLYRHRIFDTDFDEIWAGYTNQLLNHSIVRAGAVIRCYESKQLDVAYNLMLYHHFMKDKSHLKDSYNLDEEIKYNIEHTPDYKEYAPQMLRYMKRFNKMKVFW